MRTPFKTTLHITTAVIVCIQSISLLSAMEWNDLNDGLASKILSYGVPLRTFKQVSKRSYSQALRTAVYQGNLSAQYQWGKQLIKSKDKKEEGQKLIKKALEKGDSLKSTPTTPTLKDWNWAPQHDFSNTREEWNRQLKAPPFLGKFYDRPDFIQEMKPIKDCIGDISIENPLTGVISFRTAARRIGLAPIKEHYREEEIAFLKREMLYFAMALQMKMNDFKWVSHELRDLSFEEAKQEEIKLNDKKRSYNSRRLSLKKILYSRVPWRQLEGLGKFTFKLGDNRYLADEVGVFKDALPCLIKEFRNLTHELGNILSFYQDEMIGTIQWRLPEIIQFPAISNLGTFTRDTDNLQRINGVLDSLLSSNLKKNKLKSKYAILRVLNVIGECSVTLSPVTKSCVLTDDSWDAFKKVRNAFHDAQAQDQLHQIFLNTKENLWIDSLLNEFKLLSTKVKNEMKRSNWSWKDIIKCYTDDHDHPTTEKPLQLESIINLYRKMSGYLTLTEERELISLAQKPFKLTSQVVVFVKKTLLEDEKMNLEGREFFIGKLNSLTLSKNENKKLEELYKKRCGAQKKEKNNVLSEEDQKKVLNILEAIEKKTAILEEIVKNIHSYKEWNNLEKKLKEIGLTSNEDLKIWKEYHSITKLQPPIHPKGKYTTQKKVTMLCDRIETVLKDLESIFSHYKQIPTVDRIDFFLKDSVTSLAGYYLIGCFRENAQKLWDILASVAEGKKNLFSNTADKLDQYILRAKQILHNHDTTEISTLTRMGEDLVAVFRDIPFLLGDLFGIDFVFKNATINMSLKTGHKFQLPLIDARSLISKKQNDKKNSRVKKKDFPILKEEKLFGAKEWLNSSKNQNFPLKEIYDNLTLKPLPNPRYFLYTPPKKTESLLEMLSKLSSKKMNFPKESHKPFIDEPRIISEHIGIGSNSAEIFFEEIETPEDNDCALHCLGLTRKQAMELLLSNSSNEEIRKLVADEIFEGFIEGGLPIQMQDEEYHNLRYLYWEIDNDLNKIVREANNNIGSSGKTADELLNEYSAETYPILNILKEKMNTQTSVREKVFTYACKGETFKKFVKFHVGQSGQWLTYIRGADHKLRTTSLDTIAKLKGISLVIWIKDPQTQKLYVAHSFNEGVGEQLNMFHTHGLTHFNRLKKK